MASPQKLHYASVNRCELDKLINMKANKTNYLAPELEVIEISVECGFAASNDEYSDQLPEIDDEYNDIDW